jgi:hypothetical protein
VAPSVALEAPLFQAASETKILQEIVKIESKSKEVISSIDSEEMVSLQLSTIRECDIDDHRLKNQSFGMPSHLQFPPKKGFFCCCCCLFWFLTYMHDNYAIHMNC